MTDTSDSSTESEGERVTTAIRTLRSFGFTEYESKCFVALARIRTGTASDVSDVADVPQSRVYDCMETLQERGLVHVQHGTPRRFRAVAPDEAVATLDQWCRERLDRLDELLPTLTVAGQSEEAGTVWTMEGKAEISDRLVALLDDAEAEVLLAVAVEELLTDALVAALERATDRGVDVTVGSPGGPIRERLADALPAATVVETWTWWESYPIRSGAITSVFMADGHSLLVSADDRASLPGVSKHRALWTDSTDAPLVGLMRPLISNAVTGFEASSPP